MSDFININELRKSTVASSRPIKSSGSENKWDFLNKDIQLFGSGLPDKVKESFYLELGSLMDAGVDIRSSLELIQTGYKKKYQKIFSEILSQIINGSTLSQALHSQNGFSPYEFYTIQIGEETGKLGTVIKELANYFNKKIKQRRQIIGALMYPLVVIIVTLSAIAFMISYVIPMFADIYKRSGDELPSITKAVISFGDAGRHYGMSLFLSLLAFICFCFWQRKKNWFRSPISRILLKLPFWGSLMQKIYLNRFSHTMNLLLDAKLPMVTAIQLCKQIIRFYPIETALSTIEEDIIKGQSLSKALEQYKVFPRKMIIMIKVAEEVNQLEFFFKRISDQYTNEVEYQTSILSKVIEPLIIVLLGLIVGVILIAMYLPLFQLGQHF